MTGTKTGSPSATMNRIWLIGGFAVFILCGVFFGFVYSLFFQSADELLFEEPTLRHAAAPELLKAVGAKLTHYETIMLTAAGAILAAIAFVASWLYKEDTKIQEANRHRVFWVLTVIMFVTCLEYLEIWKMYISYKAYGVRLEMSLPSDLRSISFTVSHAYRPHGSAFFNWAMYIITKISIVPYPVQLLLISTFAFGHKLGIKIFRRLLVIAALGTWCFVLYGPVYAEYLALVAKARTSP